MFWFLWPALSSIVIFFIFRFEYVGNHSRFSELMDIFNSRFPYKMWNERRRAWQMPANMKNDLIQFCENYFGPLGYVIQDGEGVHIE